MSKKDRPLPKVPPGPFSRRKNQEEDSAGNPLMADEMAQALAQGKLREYLNKELPEGDEARKLADMMMSMMGMTLAGSRPDSGDGDSPPADVVKAAETGDLQDLMGLLRREHGKRSAGDRAKSKDHKGEDPDPCRSRPKIDREIIDEFLRIANDNDLSVDWLMLRAIRQFVAAYRETGRL